MIHVRTFEDMNLRIASALPVIRALPWDVIVHMPRSGTIPASLIATHLNAPFASVEEFCAGMIYTRRTNAGEAKRILLVDDSFRSGAQMADAIARILSAKPDTKITTLAIYRAPAPEEGVKAKLDMALCDEPDGDYAYPWFFWKSKRAKDYAIDFDGVLCRDATAAEDDDGEAYLNFLRKAQPKHLPTHPVGAIVTARLEKYRLPTEAWLVQHRVHFSRLIMGPWASNRERRGQAGAWKGEVYKGLRQKLFIESSEAQARTIAKVSGKTVWCVDTQKAFNAAKFPLTGSGDLD